MPLSDLTVVSLAVNIPGPVAAARLTALGAAVTTVLPPSGDPLQAFDPQWFEQLHSGQELLTLNLKDDAGLAALHDLLAGADLLLTASRPAALVRLGLDPESLAARYPRLCQLAIVGHSAEHGDLVGHDLTYQAEAGLVRAPGLPATLVADMAGAERAVSEAVAAIRQRDRTGAGVVREVALARVAYDAAEPARRGLTVSGGPLGGGVPAYNIYPCADGHIAIAALEPAFQAGVRELLDGGELTADNLAALFAPQPAAHWEQVAKDRGLPIAALRGSGAPTSD